MVVKVKIKGRLFFVYTDILGVKSSHDEILDIRKPKKFYLKKLRESWSNFEFWATTNNITASSGD